jgi:hypothetical protein
MLTDEQIIAKYGQPGDEDNIVVIDLPYPMRYVIAPGKYVIVKKMRCHRLIAPNITAVFNDLLSHYGLPDIQRLGIDFFGGCVAVRLMRGSKDKWSRHSWGIPVDLDPLRNGLKTKWEDAQFSKPEYQFMVDTFYKHGFISYGKERNFDAMHFEINV